MDREGAKRRVVRALSFHADYRCQNTGVCCSSGWEIAIETPIELLLKQRLRTGTPALPNGADGFALMTDPPANCTSAFRLDDSGTCWFRDKERGDCALHRTLGQKSLASACRQFPRVAVLEPAQVSVSLSHYCPTAAGLLFREATEFGLVEDPPAFPSDWPIEGLEASGGYSPLLRPGVLLGFDGLRAFENSSVAVLSGTSGVRTALDQIESAVHRIRGWTPAQGLVPAFVASSFRQASTDPIHRRAVTDPRPLLLASIPKEAANLPPLPAFTGSVPEIRPDIDIALRRYLAARLIGGWILFQADDLATVIAYLRVCLDSVFFFASAHEGAGAAVDRWREAIRAADLWLLHHCDPELIAANLR